MRETKRGRKPKLGMGTAAQRIPTYEDVLDLDTQQTLRPITRKKNGKDCIFIEVEGVQGVVDRYWIATAPACSALQRPMKGTRRSMR